jgi:hypothetical protein
MNPVTATLLCVVLALLVLMLVYGRGQRGPMRGAYGAWILASGGIIVALCLAALWLRH